MEPARWTNPSQPQTLQMAVFLLYINAFFQALWVLTTRGGPAAYLGDGIFGVLLVATIPGGVYGGRGIASERKWGYQLGLAMAFSPFVLRVLVGGAGAVIATNVLNLMFEIALVALLLHTQSREYERIWFK